VTQNCPRVVSTKKKIIRAMKRMKTEITLYSSNKKVLAPS